MQKIIVIAGFLILVVGVTATIFTKYNSQVAPMNQDQLSIEQGQDETMKQPKMTIDTKKKYTAIMKTTAGEMQIELYAKDAPKTVNNFVTLARKKYYENIIFHRVIEGFMIQGGDPTGTGSGGPGYTIPAEIGLPHKRGSIATARLSDQVNPEKASSGSQFYIAHQDIPQLDGEYTVFGQVVKGIEVVDAIATAPTVPGGEGSTPVTPAKILSVTIQEN